MMKLSKTSYAIALGLGLAASGQLALAQAASDVTLEKVTVTGSSIPRTETESALPIEVISRADIEKSGKQTLADVVNSITSNNNGTVPISFGQGFAHGAAGVALRGLSVNSTLVLVNGRRMASYGLTDDGQRSFVDLNSIPLDAVDRVEILKDGASAIYGSDAIAGVVNVIMSKSYNGATASYTLGQSGQGDGTEYRATFKYGMGDLATQHWNFFFDIEAGHQSQIMGDQRSGIVGSMNMTGIDPNAGDLRPGGLGNLGFSGGAFGDGNSLSRSSTVGTIIDPALTGTNGGLGGIQQLPGCNPSLLDANGLCRYEFSHYLQLQPDVTRHNIFGRLTGDFGGGTEGYFEFGVFDANTFSHGTPGGVRSTVYSVLTNKVIIQAFNIPVGTPYNPFADPARMYVAYGDGRNDYDKSSQQRYVAGVKGTKAGWDWDADIGLTHSALDSTLTGFLLYTPTMTALTTGQLLPGLNPYAGFVGTPTTASLSNIMPALNTKGSSDNDFVDVHATHEFLAMAGGNSQVSVGAEVRREKLNSPAVPYTATGEVIGLGYAQAVDSRNVSALYAEIYMPLTKMFTADLAARDDHYSTYGNSFTPKLALEFAPAQQLKIRGTASTGFRAPSASEAGKQSASAGYLPGVTDPNCPLPAGSAACTSEIGTESIGNPLLKPEKSSNYLLGFVFEPARYFNMTADLYKIIRRNEIIQSDPNVVLNNLSSFPSATITRDPVTGLLLAVGSPYINAASTTTAGFDIDLVGKTDLAGSGKLVSHLNVDHIMTFKRDFGGGIVYNYAGYHGPEVMSSGAGMPSTRAIATFDWNVGSFDTTLTANYRSHINNADNNTVTCANAGGSYSGNPIPCFTASFTTFDLSARLSVSKQWEVYGSIRNLFDRVAPYDPVAYAYVNVNNTYDQSGIIGRFLNAGVRYTLPK
jgi:iron complex outermembrane receptor protein